MKKFGLSEERCLCLEQLEDESQWRILPTKFYLENSCYTGVCVFVSLIIVRQNDVLQYLILVHVSEFRNVVFFCMSIMCVGCCCSNCMLSLPHQCL